MATHEEMFDLVDQAVHAIRAALTDGDQQGYVALWRKQSVLEHIKHADQHLLRAQHEPPVRETELRHTLIRVAMALVNLNAS